MELIGAAALVLTIQITVSNGLSAAPLAIALVLTAAIYAGFPISGGHYNPAISFAVFARGKLPLDEMLTYWVFQVAGGTGGALLGAIIGGKFTSLTIGDGYHFLQAFLVEFVFTALLCFVVLAVATNSKVEGNSYYGRKLIISFFFPLSYGDVT